MERDVPAVMRDGTVLRADVYRPAAEGRYPVLLERIPYSKAMLPLAAYCLDPLAAAAAGYAVIIQDVRGRFASDGGPFYIFRDEFNDGYDSVEWAASLPYSDGRVGMFGASYMGMTQWQAAVMQPPHLQAIFPCTSAGSAFFRRGGAVDWGLLVYWFLSSLGLSGVLRAKQGRPEARQEFLALVENIDRMDEVYRFLPLRDLPVMKLGASDQAESFAPFFRDVLDHDTFDDFHRQLSVLHRHAQVQVPAFVLAGWYDVLLGTDLNHFTRTRREAATETARRSTRLLVGPWAHAAFPHVVGERHFGLGSSGLFLNLETDLTSLHIRWFDRWLKGIRNGVDEEPPVRLFVMGKNVWRDENEWPLARTRYTPWYIHSGGLANSLRGNGTLSPEPPAAASPPDEFVYDPADPVPTRGGNLLMSPDYFRGPLEQTATEERPDVLVYTSAALNEDLEVTGPLIVKLYAASSAPDTDFTAKLVEVLPDGRAYNIADGILRARYRRGAEEPPSLIEPGRVYEYTIDLWATSMVFQRGHRLRVEVSSSNFPRFDRNLNTGELGRDSDRMAPARQTIFHDIQYPSHIVLPVVR